jgi:transcriptional regulator with XRE-family HTH domain
MPSIDIKAIREHLKYNLVEFAELICIPAATLSGMERGSLQPRRKVIDNIIARFPEIDVEQFSKQKKGTANSNSAVETILEMYRAKDKELSESKEEIASLLREIITLKDQLLLYQRHSKSDSNAASKLLVQN